MKFFRNHKKISIIALIVLIIFLSVEIAFGRYIHNILDQYILETKGFYFNSSILKVNGKGFLINNWDGVNSYTLTIDLNNRKNEERYTKTDISYNIHVDCPDTVICTLNKESGILHPEDVTDSYQITVTPIQNFYENDTVVVETYVESSKPYQKIMSATYTIGIEKSDFSYEIEDAPNEKYLLLRCSNSISYYEVEEAFLDYNVGDQIGLETYSELSEENKKKCFSAIVTVEFNPSIIFLDMTSDQYLNRLPSPYQEQMIQNHPYVSKFSFKVNASSSSEILFYKNDKTMDYTYPIVNDSSIIQVTVNIAN